MPVSIESVEWIEDAETGRRHPHIDLTLDVTNDWVRALVTAICATAAMPEGASLESLTFSFRNKAWET